MKKEYAPQFDFDNIPEQEHKIKTCKQCGKSGAYIGLDSNGLCFDCRPKTQTEPTPVQKQDKNKPNEELYRSYCDSKNKVTLPSGFNGGCLVALFYIILFSVLNRIIYRKARLKKFNFYNNKIVPIINGGWRCPCCESENLGTGYCEKCGVLPKFIKEEITE